MERVLTKPGHLHGDVHRTRNTNNGHGALHVVVVTAHLSLARLFFCDGRLYFFLEQKTIEMFFHTNDGDDDDDAFIHKLFFLACLMRGKERYFLLLLLVVCAGGVSFLSTSNVIIVMLFF